jgi:hypothetical protein
MAGLRGAALVAGDEAVHQAHGAVGVGGHVGLVGDHHHGDALVAVEGGQQVHDLAAAGGVEVAGGLVGEEQRGPGDQRPGDRHPLLLAAGELGRAVVLPAGEAHRGQRGAGRMAGGGGSPR